MKTAITKFEKKNDLLEVFVYMSWLHDTTLRSGLVQENQYGMDRKVLFLALLVFLEDIWCHGFMYQTILKSNNGKGFGEPALRTRRIVPGTISPAREVPQHILRPHYVNLSNRYSNHDDEDIPFLENQRIAPADRATIDRMRKAGILAREVLNAAIESVAIGVTTDEIDAVVHKSTIERNCYPSPLGYKGFPKSCCTSVNEVMCHGIPDSTKLQNGDIVNIDVTLFFEGVHADCSETVIVGNAEPTVRKLVDTASKALQAAIKCCGPGVSYNTIGDVIERIVKRNGFSIATDFVGHGINSEFHTAPTVCHHRINKFLGKMEVGHTFTIEPIVCAGRNSYVTWPDSWTVCTSDGLPAAQFEHTLLITEKGADVLT